MGKPGVAVIDTDNEQSGKICALLTQLSYPATPLKSLGELERHLQRNPSRVVILDLDHVPADNQFFRTFKKSRQDIHILVISNLPYHPGLEEAMGSYIYACLGKPLDPEELIYWLKSISENLSISESASEV
jgi:DNA-binding NtrC family response regulator